MRYFITVFLLLTASLCLANSKLKRGQCLYDQRTDNPRESNIIILGVHENGYYAAKVFGALVTQFSLHFNVAEKLTLTKCSKTAKKLLSFPEYNYDKKPKDKSI